MGLRNVERDGEVSLRVLPGLPAWPKGLVPSWPMATYEISFTGKLAAQGYLDISFYIGGLDLRGSPSQVRLLAWDGEKFTEVPSKVDVERGVLSGRARRPGTFVIVTEPPR